MGLKLTVEEALVAADYWSAGATFHEDDRSLRAICMVLAGEVRKLRESVSVKPSGASRMADDIVDRLRWKHERYCTTVDTIESDAADEIERLRSGIDDCEHMLLTEANIRAALERAEQMMRDLRAPYASYADNIQP